jgi:hypothetical protein
MKTFIPVFVFPSTKAADLLLFDPFSGSTMRRPARRGVGTPFARFGTE